jgi:GntR family transcriptional regulator
MTDGATVTDGRAVGEIRRDSPIPLYRQLKLLIARDIAQGVLGPNDPVGPESELSRRHNVSRITVRQALGELQQEGLITRIVGKGTFVNDRPRAGRLTRLAGFAEEIRAIGLEPRYETLVVEFREAPSQIATFLQLPARAEVLYIERRLLADDEPVAFARSHLPAELFQGSSIPIDRALLDRRSLYELLEQEAGLVLDRATEEVEPQQAGPAEAELLDLDVGDLLLRVHRRVFDSHGRPLEDVDLLYAGSRYAYRVQISRG